MDLLAGIGGVIRDRLGADGVDRSGEGSIGIRALDLGPLAGAGATGLSLEPSKSPFPISHDLDLRSITRRAVRAFARCDGGRDLPARRSWVATRQDLALRDVQSEQDRERVTKDDPPSTE